MFNKKELKYLFYIAITFIAACAETDIYLPAFADMMLAFSVSEGAIQSLITWNFLGICLASPIYGPLSDSFGRKKPLLLALALFFFGSLTTTLAVNFPLMLTGRLMQGLGAGGCFTLGTAIIFDAFQKNRAVKAINMLNMSIPILMSLAPILGSYLTFTYGFKANFLFISFLVGLSFLLCAFFLDESLESKRRSPLSLPKILADGKKVFSSLPFWQLSLATSLLFAVYISFLSYTTLLFVSELGIPKQKVPGFQLCLLGIWTIAGLILHKALNRFSQEKIKKTGLALSSIGLVGFTILSFFCPQNPYCIIAALLPYSFGANWVFSLYFPEAMELMPEIKGTTASLLTSSRLFLAAVILGLTSLLYNGTIYPLTLLSPVCMGIIFSCIFSYEKKRIQEQEEY